MKVNQLFLCDLELDALEERLEGCFHHEDLNEGLDALGIDMSISRAITCLEIDNFGQCALCGDWTEILMDYSCDYYCHSCNELEEAVQ